jgi:hypothetical protein
MFSSIAFEVDFFGGEPGDATEFFNSNNPFQPLAKL